jgi:5-methylcytosine-specific restriction endonuclease McrA
MPVYTKCGCGKKILKGTQCECRKNRYKDYDKRVRNIGQNKKYANFYNSAAWKKLSEYIKRKYNGVCLKCLLRKEDIIPCDVAHHIEPIRYDYSKRLEEKNLIPLCHNCHNDIDHVNYTEEVKNELRMLLKEYEEKFIYTGGVLKIFENLCYTQPDPSVE